MNAKSEQTLVGLFVIVAAGVLIATVFAISGAFGRSVKTFHTYFGFAGGLEPGATVRYYGGTKAGRVEKMQIDPQDPTRIEVTFSVQTDVPVKTDATIREKLEPGHEAWALLDLPGDPVVLKGKVLYVSSVADAASGTRRVRVEMANPTRWPAATRTRVRFNEPSAEWTAFVQEGVRAAAAEAGTPAQIGGDKK